jgi:antitoxin HigA-1
MRMNNPPHPGELIREECLIPLGLTVVAAARALGVTRKALSRLVNGHSGISPDMAIRLSKAFGSEPETWLGMQMEYDLWHATRRASRLKIKRLYPADRKAA